MTPSDITFLAGWFIGAFGIGLCSGFLIGLFITILKTISYYL